MRHVSPPPYNIFCISRRSHKGISRWISSSSSVVWWIRCFPLYDARELIYRYYPYTNADEHEDSCSQMIIVQRIGHDVRAAGDNCSQIFLHHSVHSDLFRHPRNCKRLVSKLWFELADDAENIFCAIFRDVRTTCTCKFLALNFWKQRMGQRKKLYFRLSPIECSSWISTFSSSGPLPFLFFISKISHLLRFYIDLKKVFELYYYSSIYGQHRLFEQLFNDLECTKNESFPSSDLIFGKFIIVFVVGSVPVGIGIIFLCLFS